VGDLFVFLLDGDATVWNPIQDSWARWHIGIVGKSVCTCLVVVADSDDAGYDGDAGFR
jgi:hypothetical protein